MPTMADIYGPEIDHPEHEACPACGWCLVCGACFCDQIAEYGEEMRFPYVSTIEGPAMEHHRKMEKEDGSR